MIEPSLAFRYNVPVPRYTSYPPAPAWKPMSGDDFSYALSKRDPKEPLSLYLHIPFCQSICLYCGCSTMMNRDPHVEERYVSALRQEIGLISKILGSARVNQIHFGGGTPTKLRGEQLSELLSTLYHSFSVDQEAEIAIEIDPRSVSGENSSLLNTLKAIGCTRISLGIQDFDTSVQEAIGRRQSKEQSISIFQKGKQLGFKSINFDLIYGLPRQTSKSFQKTIDLCLSLRPHRIAMFSFAYLPELKAHQKAIPPSLLPSPEEKFQIYLQAREKLILGGYRAIGLDHFALPEDPLCKSLERGTLRRTFQGYTVQEGSEVIGMGMTGISDLRTGFFQHAKTLPEYFDFIDRGKLPTQKGILLSEDDLRRRSIIEQIMCHGKIDKEDFLKTWGVPFDTYFQESLIRLKPLVDDGLVTQTAISLEVTIKGQLFLRNIASCFDAYLSQSTVHSRAI